MRKDGSSHSDIDEPDPWWARAIAAIERSRAGRIAGMAVVVAASALLWLAFFAPLGRGG